MSTIPTFTFTKEEIEDWLDSAKLTVVSSLVREGALDFDDADEWSTTHTIILRKKNVFKSISNTWRKAEECKGHYFLVVALPKAIEVDDDDGAKEDVPEDDKNKVVELIRRA